LQRPLPDGSLRIVARGVKEDTAFAGLSDMNTFVSDPDREARADSVKNAVATCRMEGGEPAEYCLEQLALFEAGHISVTEMRDRVVRHAQSRIGIGAGGTAARPRMSRTMNVPVFGDRPPVSVG